jgi:hypothetical protein
MLDDILNKSSIKIPMLDDILNKHSINIPMLDDILNKHSIGGFLSTNGTRRVTHVANPMINHE